MKNTCSKNRVREHLPSNWSEFDTLLGQVFGAESTGGQSRRCAPASVWEDEAAYHLELDLPGVAQADVEITLEKGVLQIVAERQAHRARASESARGTGVWQSDADAYLARFGQSQGNRCRTEQWSAACDGGQVAGEATQAHRGEIIAGFPTSGPP